MVMVLTKRGSPPGPKKKYDLFKIICLYCVRMFRKVVNSKKEHS